MTAVFLEAPAAGIVASLTAVHTYRGQFPKWSPIKAKKFLSPAPQKNLQENGVFRPGFSRQKKVLAGGLGGAAPQSPTTPSEPRELSFVVGLPRQGEYTMFYRDYRM